MKNGTTRKRRNEIKLFILQLFLKYPKKKFESREIFNVVREKYTIKQKRGINLHLSDLRKKELIDCDDKTDTYSIHQRFFRDSYQQGYFRVDNLLVDIVKKLKIGRERDILDFLIFLDKNFELSELFDSLNILVDDRKKYVLPKLKAEERKIEEKVFEFCDIYDIILIFHKLGEEIFFFNRSSELINQLKGTKVYDPDVILGNIDFLEIIEYKSGNNICDYLIDIFEIISKIKIIKGVDQFSFPELLRIKELFPLLRGGPLKKWRQDEKVDINWKKFNRLGKKYSGYPTKLTDFSEFYLSFVERYLIKKIESNRRHLQPILRRIVVGKMKLDEKSINKYIKERKYFCLLYPKIKYRIDRGVSMDTLLLEIPKHMYVKVKPPQKLKHKKGKIQDTIEDREITIQL